MKDLNKTKWIEKVKTKKGMMIGALAVVAVAILIGLGIYNLPANRLNRQLELGQKYLEEQNYEEAIVAFNQAIEIDDRCLEAYAGSIEAYVQSGNVEELPAFYEKALEAVRNTSDEEIQKQIEEVCVIYSAADDVYEEDDALEILEEGYLLLEGIPGAEGCEEDYANAVTAYLDQLLGENNYVEVKRFIEERKGMEIDVDLEQYLALADEMEAKEAEKIAFLSEIYTSFENGDYSKLYDWIYKKEVATPFVSCLETDYCIYIPEDANGLNGMGVGVYKFGLTKDGITPYYYYYGYYENGVRQGEGLTYYNYGDAMTVFFEGNWENDAPNGEGMEVKYGPNGDVYVSGDLVNGLWDGEVSTYCDEWFEGTEYSMMWSASNGVPTEDKTSEYASLYAKEKASATTGGGVIASGGFIQRGFDYEALSEGEYIYAYDQKRYLWTTKNSAIGVLGYGTEWEEWEYVG